MDRPKTVLDKDAEKVLKRLKSWRKEMYDDNYNAIVLEALIYLVTKVGRA